MDETNQPTQQPDAELSSDDVQFIRGFTETDSDLLVAEASMSVPVQPEAEVVASEQVIVINTATDDVQVLDQSVYEEDLRKAERLTEAKLAEDGLPFVHVIQPHLKTSLDEIIIEGLEKIYPGVSEYAIGYPSTNQRLLTIYFPEITIRNSQNKKHKITEAYVRIVLTHENGTLTGFTKLTFSRSHVTYDEACYKYLHSHASSATMESFVFQGMCLGDGDFVTLGSSLNIQIDPESLEFYLHFLRNYLEYENDEGRPYLYMRNIGAKNHTLQTLLPVDNNMVLSSTKELILKYNKLQGVHLVNRGCLSLLAIDPNNDGFQEQLEGLNSKIKAVYFPETHEYKSYAPGSAARPAFKSGRSLFNFRNRTITLTIEEPKDTDVIDFIEVLHPQYVEYVAKRAATWMNLLLYNDLRLDNEVVAQSNKFVTMLFAQFGQPSSVDAPGEHYSTTYGVVERLRQLLINTDTPLTNATDGNTQQFIQFTDTAHTASNSTFTAGGTSANLSVSLDGVDTNSQQASW